MIWLAVALLLAGALLLLVAARREQESDDGPAAVWEAVQEGWIRLGFAGGRRGVALELALMCSASLPGWLMGKPLWALLGPGAWLMLRIVLGQLKRGARKRQLLRQLPGFIGQVNRRIEVGITLEKAVQQSAAASQAPLGLVLERAVQRIQLGEELADSFSREARLTGVPEFGLLATMFSVNHQFGGSVREALNGLVTLLEQRERSQRELRAMTGETRVTAWVMGAMPLLMVCYMLVINPDYILGLWLDEGGRRLLYAGGLMQLTGMLALWRMLRSV
ncbi:pilus assembly protein TadB [Zobellella endophytica]|uniref:Pilus assembly protein TadB n=1 Tax=Zobellella endophytica TaxID=2116700 RepID=A0A2P7RD49_9GAMM|nr:type II secretion system F family protein [Zobellella endophytica]PSJ48135.1 pilus assembly protein TadB [Zobellella endophytica]